MHPLIARFLDFPNTAALLERGPTPALDADEAAVVAAGESAPKERALILAAQARGTPSAEAQQRALVLLTRAATARLLDDAALGTEARAALAALTAEGATAAEAEGLVAQVLLEEAFGFASDPSEFDAPYVRETLASLVRLATLSAELVDGWLDRFAKQGPKASAALRLAVAETLFEAAWSDGPQPITLEHVDDAMDGLADGRTPLERTAAQAALRELIAFLASEGVVGPLRAARLTELVDSARGGDDDEGDSDADDDQEGDDASSDDEAP